MTREMYLKEIKNHILRQEEGTMYIPSDFLDMANVNAVNKALSRLASEGTIRRILQGVYEYPKYSSFLKEYVSPSPEKIAKAIARKNNWKIIPYKDVALNILGLSTQVPSTYIYASDGVTKTYELADEYNNLKIIFKKTPQRDITGISEKAALIIQAQKAKGKDNIDDRFLRKISMSLTPEEKHIILSETQNSTSWIYENIKKMINVRDYEENCNIT
jgi:hypothetical protein